MHVVSVRDREQRVKREGPKWKGGKVELGGTGVDGCGRPMKMDSALEEMEGRAGSVVGGWYACALTKSSTEAFLESRRFGGMYDSVMWCHEDGGWRVWGSMMGVGRECELSVKKEDAGGECVYLGWVG